MTTQEFIDAWHKGEEVTVIEMGGLGKGYEIAIWEFAIQCLNYMENTEPFFWETFNAMSIEERKTYWKTYRDHAERGAYGRGDEKGPLAESLDLLGLSGSQWGAAWSAASVLNRHGYDIALSMAEPERRIKLSKGGLSLNPEELVKVE